LERLAMHSKSSFSFHNLDMLGYSPFGGRDGNIVHPPGICGVRLKTGSGT